MIFKTLSCFDPARVLGVFRGPDKGTLLYDVSSVGVADGEVRSIDIELDELSDIVTAMKEVSEPVATCLIGGGELTARGTLEKAIAEILAEEMPRILKNHGYPGNA